MNLDQPILKAIVNYEEFGGKSFTDDLYRVVWKDQRFDILNLALNSANDEVRGTASFVLHETASRDYNKVVLETALSMGAGSHADELNFVKYFCESGHVHEVATQRMASLFELNILVIRSLAIRYFYVSSNALLDELGKIVFKTDSYRLKEHRSFDNLQVSRDRSLRALRMVIMMKSQWPIEKIESNSCFEDSFTLEQVQSCMGFYEKSAQTLPNDFLGEISNIVE